MPAVLFRLDDVFEVVSLAGVYIYSVAVHVSD
jgi:hypothetical protein